MHVQITLESSSGQFHEQDHRAIPEKTVEQMREDHNAWLNDGGGQRSKSYSFERTDGEAGKISLDFERVATIDAFERSNPSFGGVRT